jgi:hypothetical protein
MIAGQRQKHHPIVGHTQNVHEESMVKKFNHNYAYRLATSGVPRHDSRFDLVAG